MKTKMLWSFGAVVAIVGSVGADIKSDWQKILDSYCTAAKKKDLKTADKIVRANFSKDFKFVSSKGVTQNLEEWIKGGHDEMNMTSKVNTFSLHIDSLKPGKATSEMMMTITFAGMVQLDPKGKPGEMKYVGKSATTLTKSGSKWLISKIVEKSGNTTFNGKPLKM